VAGRAAEALDPLRTAMALSAVSEDALLGGEIMYECGLALSDLGRETEASQSYMAALDAFERIGANGWVDRVRNSLEEPRKDMGR
jgi:hypothetical protein